MILVTGATGTVGSAVVHALKDRGVAVRAFVRDPAKSEEMLGTEVELASGDFGDVDSIQRGLKGVDTVFLACSNDPRQVEYETNVIDATAAAGVKRIVKLSALGAEVGSPLDFWDWQGRIEDHLARSGLPAVVLRPTTYMSGVLASAEQIKATGRLFAPADGAKIAFVDPRDVAAVAAVALNEDGHEGQTYVLSGPEAITYEDVAAHLSTAAGRTVEFVDVPDEAARSAMLEAGMPDWLVHDLVTLFGFIRRGAAEQTTDTVRSLTGRAPRTFAEFAHDHADLFRG